VYIKLEVECDWHWSVASCVHVQVAMNPDNTVFDAKRLIGRRYDDPSVQSDMKHWPFNIVNDGGKPKIRVDYKSEQKTFFPEEISSMVLVKMKEIAEAYLGKVLISCIGCTAESDSIGRMLMPTYSIVVAEIGGFIISVLNSFFYRVCS